MTRDEAWCLLTEFTLSESLRKHALAVEACVRAYARKFGEDEEVWGLVGLIHDFDYEKYPSAEEHPFTGSEILKERGVSEEIRRAILSHANYSGVPRESRLEKTLFACDELAGHSRGPRNGWNGRWRSGERRRSERRRSERRRSERRCGHPGGGKG